VADRSLRYQPAVSGNGFGEELLAPPAQTSRLEVSRSDMVEAEVGVEPSASARMFGLIACTAPRDTDDVIADAVRAAAAADVAVVVLGLTEEQETESVDKTTLRLPGAQDVLLDAVAAAAKKTIVVVNAATPVIMPWLDHVDAVLWAGLPGQEGGHAVAAALLGDIEPAGRLVTTFPVEDAHAPAWSVTPVDGSLEYREGTFIGYRGHFAGHAPTPAFWFGHGLGYSSWEYTGARRLAGEGSPRVAVTVTNTGARESREIVQLYFRPAESNQPTRLVGWQPVHAAPGQSMPVEIHTDARLWRRWVDAAGGWDSLTGGALLLARGLGDIRATIDLDADRTGTSTVLWG
jgi:beta-glucosidase